MEEILHAFLFRTPRMAEITYGSNSCAISGKNIRVVDVLCKFLGWLGTSILSTEYVTMFL
jgi:hypothetical protein